MYLKAPTETIDNFQDVLAEYRTSLADRKEVIKKLQGELKQIKHLRV